LGQVGWKDGETKCKMLVISLVQAQLEVKDIETKYQWFGRRSELSCGPPYIFSGSNPENWEEQLEVEEAHMDGEMGKVEGENRRQRKGRARSENQKKNQLYKNFFLEDESEEHHFNPFLPSSPNSTNYSLSKTQIR
jgi:hypothetical protein